MSGGKNDIYMIARSGKAKHLSRFFDVKEVPEMAEDNKKNTGNGATNKDPSQMSRYELVRAGLVEPVGSEKGWLNLIPIADRPEDEQREIRRKGCAGARRVEQKRKTTKEILDFIGSLPATESASEFITPDIMAQLGEGATQKDVLNAAMYLQAQAGNVKAAVYVRDSIGEKPADVMQVEATVSPEDMELVNRVNKRLAGIAPAEEAKPE